tara:strand:- start:24858 stop:25766 length:909 start_codon:yes stop_codon:yes gene_type:complete
MQDVPPRNAFNFKHSPVLANEVIESISKIPETLLNKGVMIDATLGGGGHAALILDRNPNLKIIGIDQDPNAREAAAQNLKDYGSRVEIIDSNFADFVPDEKVIVVFADLGVSSHQLDIPSRGFSFRSDGPIDMRMNPLANLTAADLLEQLNEEQLANTIYQFGEERLSRRIARKIKNDISNNGPYKTTKDLAYAIAGCFPSHLRRSRLHPATRTFQALRIAVNKELEVLDRLLSQAPEWIIPGGLFEVISFHSLEDRKVKTSFLKDERLEIITRKPIRADNQEISMNKRSRSAKLRISKKKQ